MRAMARDAAIASAHHLGAKFHAQGADCEIIIRDPGNKWSEEAC